jgi:hypothetical protein
MSHTTDKALAVLFAAAGCAFFASGIFSLPMTELAPYGIAWMMFLGAAGYARLGFGGKP